MLFALYDYYQFVTKTGRYGRFQTTGFMSVAHEGRVPPDVLRLLEDGDVIFTQRLDSRLSWAVLYFTSSTIDHVGLFLKPDRILHATAEGVKEHAVNAVAKGCRILPVRFAPHESELPFNPPDSHGSDVYTPSGWKAKLPMRWQFAIGGFRILLGLHPDRYRLKFYLDFLIAGIVLDLITYSLVGVTVCTMVAFGFAIISALNAIFLTLRERDGRPYRRISHPDIGYASFNRLGGIMFSRVGPMMTGKFGVMPVGLFLNLARSEGNEVPDDLWPLMDDVRILAKRWGLADGRGVSDPDD